MQKERRHVQTEHKDRAERGDREPGHQAVEKDQKTGEKAGGDSSASELFSEQAVKAHSEKGDVESGDRKHMDDAASLVQILCGLGKKPLLAKEHGLHHRGALLGEAGVQNPLKALPQDAETVQKDISASVRCKYPGPGQREVAKPQRAVVGEGIKASLVGCRAVAAKRSGDENPASDGGKALCLLRCGNPEQDRKVRIAAVLIPGFQGDVLYGDKELQTPVVGALILLGGDGAGECHGFAAKGEIPVPLGNPDGKAQTDRCGKESAGKGERTAHGKPP